MTYKVVKQWRPDVQFGEIVAAGDHGLAQADLDFLVAAGLLQTVTTTQHQPAKLKNTKRKD